MKSCELDDLLEAITRNEPAAFPRLYALTCRRVTAIATKILRNREDAEEVVQEVYLKIWRQAGTFHREEGSANEWIGAIARNSAIDFERNRKPVASCLDDEQDMPSLAPNPEELSVAASDRAAINRSMATLHTDRADAVRQAYVQGFSYQQLSEIHSVPINTMRTWLRRSLITLRHCLVADGHERGRPNSTHTGRQLGSITLTFGVASTSCSSSSEPKTIPGPGSADSLSLPIV